MNIFLLAVMHSSNSIIVNNYLFKVYCYKLYIFCILNLFFYKKLRIWASTGSSLKLLDFEYSEFLTSFLKVPDQSSCPLTWYIKNFSKRGFLKPFQRLDYTQVPYK